MGFLLGDASNFVPSEFVGVKQVISGKVPS